MSFKRDGDDKNLIKNLNDQRVRELLGSHIPQDEAKLLSNGRLTCTICIHRPIFDTINMLANHRRGKRHLSELSKYIKCKEELELKAAQQKYDHLSGLSVHKLVKTSESLAQSSLLGYKHVTAKQNVHKYRRKPILEIRHVSKKNIPNPPCQDSPEKKALTTVKHYLKKMSRKTSLEKVVERNRENYGVDLQSVKKVSNSPKSSPAELEPDLPQSEGKSRPKAAETQDYETKLRMAGWIKDLTGKWVKDPNVEFDSDEDETPPPPPT